MDCELNTAKQRDISTSIHAEARGRQKQFFKTMNTSNLSLANRKQLADLLKNDYQGLRYKAKRRFSERADALRVSLVKEFAETKGALAVVHQIETATERLDELKEELTSLGFELDHRGNLAFTSDGSSRLAKTVDKRIEKEIGSDAAIDARFDSAQIALMTVATLEDAKKILESVSVLCE